jgi:hypothetical protein
VKGPPDQTVRVTFDPDATPQFTFDPDSVRMTAAGKVILLQHPASARWTFRDAMVKDDTLHEFHPEVQGSGNALHIIDDFRDKTKKSYSYNVTVALDGNTVTSPDPVIVNDPGA